MTPNVSHNWSSGGSRGEMVGGLRGMALTWAVAGMLPLPLLVATDPSGSGVISCLYLGLASAWLAAEFGRLEGRGDSFMAWRGRTMALAFALATNVAVFIAFGMAAGVSTRFPFPLMAVLSAAPAVGLVPWLMRCVRHPYAAIVLAAVVVLACKLAACVVARVVYGPDFDQRGYIAGDWTTARLMISLFWTFSTVLSTALLVVEGIAAAAARQREAEA
jgi:hypothetical protein